MTDPQSPHVGIYLPTTGSNIDTWGTVLNANGSVQDSLASNVASISLTNANVTLSIPPTTGTAWAGPYQSQSAVLKLSGVLTGNCTISIPRPGFWIVENNCTVGTFVVSLQSTGKRVSAPPGEVVTIYCDGTDCKYVGLGRVGELVPYPTVGLPPWVTSCNVFPYLVCDGTTFNISDFPALGALLGATFGGNGSSTFAVPDLRGRVAVNIDPGLGRITSATMTPDGITRGAVNVSANPQSNILTAGNIPVLGFTGNPQTVNLNSGVIASNPTRGTQSGNNFFSNDSNVQTVSVTMTPSGSVNVGSPNTAVNNMQPSLITGITLIKT